MSRSVKLRKSLSNGHLSFYYLGKVRFFIGGGGPGLRRGGSFLNILQFGEGETCFICNRGRVIVSW